MCLFIRAPLIAFAPVWWERRDEGEEPKRVRRRKATAFSLQPLSATGASMKQQAAQNGKLRKNRLHVFHGSQNYVFSNVFFFRMSRILGFSANFNEHLTKSREKKRRKSKALCQMYQYGLIDSSADIGSTLHPSFLSVGKRVYFLGEKSHLPFP